MSRKNILVLYGGESSEHTVSVVSAQNIVPAINTAEYDVTLCFVDTTGRWWLQSEVASPSSGGVELIPHLGTNTMITIGEPHSRTIRVDIIFPLLHGENGEDGSVQGLAQLLHVPVVGCGVESSSICMDKIAAKEIAHMHGMTVVQYFEHEVGVEEVSYEDASALIGNVMFVKPANTGSSVGVSKVANAREFDAALAKAHQYSTKVLIEQAVDARELEVAVIGAVPVHYVSSVGEIIPGEEFFTYEDKYAADTKSQTIVPADISIDVADSIRAKARDIFSLFRCQGLARIDFFLTKDGTVYFNEANTMPGMRTIGMYLSLLAHDGFTVEKVVDILLRTALGEKIDIQKEA